MNEKVVKYFRRQFIAFKGHPLLSPGNGNIVPFLRIDREKGRDIVIADDEIDVLSVDVYMFESNGIETGGIFAAVGKGLYGQVLGFVRQASVNGQHGACKHHGNDGEKDGEFLFHGIVSAHIRPLPPAFVTGFDRFPGTRNTHS